MKDNYTGIYYDLATNEPIVVTFKPIVAKKTTAEEQALFYLEMCPSKLITETWQRQRNCQS